MSLSPSESTEVRRNRYKVAVDADEGRRRREDNMAEIRKSKREESLQNKRREGLQNQHLPAAVRASAVEKKLEHLPAMVAGVWTDDGNLQLEATTQFRKLLSIEHSPPIEEVIQAGVVPRFVEFLMREDFPQLQFEAAWVLKNIASGTSENTRVVIDHGAVPIFVKLLGSPSDDVREQAVWALGNVAGDSPRCCDLVLGHGALRPLLAQLNENAKLSMLSKATWTLSIFCRGKPQLPFDQVKPALPALARLINSNDEVLTAACWALSYLSDGTNEKIQAVIEAGVCPRLVEFLMHPSPSVLIPALQTVDNIVTGDDMQTQGGVDPASRSMEKSGSVDDVIDAKPWQMSKTFVLVILQFLEEEKFEESAHKLEQESGIYFNLKYFDEKVQSGEWDEVEKYLSRFTKVDDNQYSVKIFFEIMKQKYLEALYRQDKAKAAEILGTDLEVFSTFNEELYKEISQFFSLRENERLPKYGDTKTARSIMLIELKKLIEANPLFLNKLTFPPMKSSRLWALIKHGLKWELRFSKNPRPNPDVKKLFIDYLYTTPFGPLAPTPLSLPVAAVAKPVSYTSLGAHDGGVYPASKNMEKSGSVDDVIDAKPWQMSKTLVLLILQFLEEEKFEESAHKLEQESGIYFNMKYFEEKVQSGEWDAIEKYLSGFTKVDDNQYSMKFFFEIRKQKYLEALDRQDKAKAAEILGTDLEVFSTFNEELYKEVTQFFSLRENERLPKYGDTKTARSIMLIELKKLIEANPLFLNKLTFPPMKSSRLWALIKHGLKWELRFSKNPRPNPDVKKLFIDYLYTTPFGPLAPAPLILPVAAVAKPANESTQ